MLDSYKSEQCFEESLVPYNWDTIIVEIDVNVRQELESAQMRSNNFRLTIIDFLLA